MATIKYDEAFLEFIQQVADSKDLQNSVPFFDLELFEDFDLSTGQIRAAIFFVSAALQNSAPAALLEHKKDMLGPWEFLDSKGMLSTGLRSTLIRYEFGDDYKYWLGDIDFSAYIAPPSVPTAGSTYSSRSRTWQEGLFLPGGAYTTGEFAVLLCSSDGKTARVLTLRRASGELVIDGNSFKRGGVRP